MGAVAGRSGILFWRRRVVGTRRYRARPCGGPGNLAGHDHGDVAMVQPADQSDRAAILSVAKDRFDSTHHHLVWNRERIQDFSDLSRLLPANGDGNV